MSHPEPATRPSHLPAAARWSPTENEWILPSVDANGAHHGLVTWWRPEGSLVCTAEYLNGALHGRLTRFHDTGEIASEGHYLGGRHHGPFFFVRADGPTSEAFPAGLGEAVHRAEMHYENGSAGEARCFDRSGKRCLDDGKPYPEQRPAAVPEAAHFGKRQGHHVWMAGAADNTDGKTVSRRGTWRFWSADGVLLHEENYEQGQLHGAAKTFDERGRLTHETSWHHGKKNGLERRYHPESGAVLEELTFVDGARRGPFTRAIDGTDLRERGEYTERESVGTLEYVRPDGSIVDTINMGPRIELDAIEVSIEADTELAATFRAMAATHHAGATLFLCARAVGRQELEAATLASAIKGFRRPWPQANTDTLTEHTLQVIRQVARMSGDPAKTLRTAMDGIRQGADGPTILRRAAGALDDFGESAIGLELINAAILVADESRKDHLEFTRALIRSSLGDPAGAMASVRTYLRTGADEAHGLRAYIEALFPRWAFWPKDDARIKDLEPILTVMNRFGPKKPEALETITHAIQQCATRLVETRRLLVERFGDQQWVVPDLSHLLPNGPVKAPAVKRHDGIGYQHEARRDWTRLTWLCYSIGLDEIALPSAVSTRGDYLATSIISLARAQLIHEQDPKAALAETLKKARDLVDEENWARLIRHAVERAEACTWFGLSTNHINALPDASFLVNDEVDVLSAIRFIGNAQVDLFDSEE